MRGAPDAASPSTPHLLQDEPEVSARAAQKVRSREQGWRYAVAQLEEAGAVPPVSGEDLRAWLRVWLPQMTRRQRHRGNHRYLWVLRPSVRLHLPPSLPYPKWEARLVSERAALSGRSPGNA